jgi:hypothetical protein
MDIIRASRLPLLLLALAGCTPTEEPPVGDDDDATDEPSGDWRFVDHTAGSGLDFDSPPPPREWDDDERPIDAIAGDFTTGGGAAAADFDGDGSLDVLLTAPWGEAALYLNDGTGSFAKKAGPFEERRDENVAMFGATAGDLDGDGDVDLLLHDGPAMRTFWNQGGAEFVEGDALVTHPDSDRSFGAALADLDGDGNADVFACAYSSDDADHFGVSRVLFGLGGGQFEDRSDDFASLDDRTGQCFQASFLDIDGDGTLEVLLANDQMNHFQRNKLLWRDGLHWVDRAFELGLSTEMNSMGAAVADLDGDNWPEIGISDTDSLMHLFRYDPTEGIESYVDVTFPWGVSVPEPAAADASWAVIMEDLDDDGWPDLGAAWGYPKAWEADAGQDQVNLIWRNGGGSFLEKITLPCPAGRTWRTLIPGDFDGDGRQDVLSGALVGAPCLVRGVGGPNGFVEVEVDGPPGNPHGLGTQVRVWVDGVKQTRLLTLGNSGVHSSWPAIARVGIGEAEQADLIQLRFPGGGTAEVENVGRNERVVVPYVE